MLLDEHVEALLEKYIKPDTVVSFGTGPTNETFLKKLGLYIEHNDLNVKAIPTSHSMSLLCSELNIRTVSLDDVEVDLAFDFADQVDEDFNYISNETTSLVRDKMIAQEAAEFIVVCEEKDYVSQMKFDLCFEVCPFAVKKTVIQVMSLGQATHRLNKSGQPALSETGNHFIDISIDEIYDIEDIEYQAKRIPGVLETSLFVGYADRVLLHGSTLTMKSRMNNPDKELAAVASEDEIAEDAD